MIVQQLKFSSVVALLLSQVIDGKRKEMDMVHIMRICKEVFSDVGHTHSSLESELWWFTTKPRRQQLIHSLISFKNMY